MRARTPRPFRYFRPWVYWAALALVASVALAVIIAK